MKIAILLPALTRRGNEKQALRIAIGLQKRGIQSVVFNLEGWGDYETEFNKNNIPVINIKKPNTLKKNYIDTEIKKNLISSIRKENCNLIFSINPYTHDISIRANRDLKMPLILLMTNAIMPLIGGIFKKLKIKIKFHIKYRNVNYIVTVSKKGCDNMESYFFKKNIIPILNWININEIEQKSNLRKSIYKNIKINILYVGSIDINRKGLDILLKSIRILHKENKLSSVQFHIVGSGIDQSVFSKKISSYNLQEWIIMHGEIKNPYPYIKQADIFVLPSRREGMPTVILEAMSLGKSVIASDCFTGPDELINSGENGFLVEVENPEDLATKLKLLISNEKLRLKFGQNARRTVISKYSLDQMIDEYVKLFKKFYKY